MNFGIVPRKTLLCVFTLTLSLAAITQEPIDKTNLQSGGTTPSQTPAAPPDDAWHLGFTPYLWLAGMYGTVGAKGFETTVHASFSDIFSSLNIGLMGAVEARKKRFVLGTDFMWMRLSDEKAPAINGIGLIDSADVKVRQFLLTPVVGYRVLDKQQIKVDAVVGMRYWHLGQELELTPTVLGGLSETQNWVDALGGARIQIPLSQKAKITIIGDAGGGGANSDYQVAGLFGYGLGKRCVLQAGWRYLDVDYRNSNSFVFDAITDGALVGVTINLK